MTQLLEDLDYGVMGIYKINFPNGKIYIGLSNDIKRRMFEHNSPSENSTPCDNAINKYGRVLEVEILERVENTEDLCEREIYWIDYYQSYDRDIGYNLTKGGMASFGEDNHKAVFFK